MQEKIAGKKFGGARMVGPNGLEPSTSSVSRKRSNQTELRAYMGMAAVQFYRASGDYGNVSPPHGYAESRADYGLESSRRSL